MEAYTEVAKRLGIMNEGEPPRGAGPGAGQGLGNIGRFGPFACELRQSPALCRAFGVSSLGVDSPHGCPGGPATHGISRKAMKARVTVTLKSGILDPQGKAIEGALRSLGVEGVASVRQGKVFDIEIEGTDRGQGREPCSSRPPTSCWPIP